MFLHTPVLLIPNPDKIFYLHTDVSNVGINGILLQKKGETLHPYAYHSRKLLPARKNYNIHDYELLAIVFSLKFWRRSLEGTQILVQISTDHNNLLHFTKKLPQTLCHICWEIELSNYNFVLGYISGKKNILPDGLSRRPDYREVTDYEEYNIRPILKEEVFLNTFQLNQATSELLTQLLESQQTLISNQDESLLTSKLQVHENRIWQQGLLYIPPEFCVQIISYHPDNSLGGHQGYQKTLDLIKENFYWPGITKMLKDSSWVVRTVKKINTRHLDLLENWFQSKLPKNHGNQLP